MKRPNRPARQTRRADLLYADTRRSADQRYLGGFEAPDPFVSFRKGSRSYALLNQLEYGRAMRESRFDEVLRLEDWVEKARKERGKRDVRPAEIIAAVAKAYRIGAFKAPGDFPAAVAFELTRLGFDLDVVDGSLFPERERKSDQERKWIREGNRCSAAGLREAERLLRAARVRNGKLHCQGKPLTSERVREAIEIACLQRGALSLDTIVAGGDQACDPHCLGHGPLRANDLIIVDVFPRVTRTGYHGDMTRTFLKGRPSEAQKALVAAVRRAQRAALEKVRAGAPGKTAHKAAVETFERLGYETGRSKSGGYEGFFHGTGHGLGLEVHETPRVSTAPGKLKRGAVVTIEPGLYYPGLGGCRIEDVVAVEDDGCEKLSSYPYRWILA